MSCNLYLCILTQLNPLQLFFNTVQRRFRTLSIMNTLKFTWSTRGKESKACILIFYVLYSCRAEKFMIKESKTHSSHKSKTHSLRCTLSQSPIVVHKVHLKLHFTFLSSNTNKNTEVHRLWTSLCAQESGDLCDIFKGLPIIRVHTFALFCDSICFSKDVKQKIHNCVSGNSCGGVQCKQRHVKRELPPAYKYGRYCSRTQIDSAIHCELTF